MNKGEKGHDWMIIAKNDEEKRSKIWRVTMITSSLVILAVAVFFIFRMFAANPLEGTWQYEEADVVLTIMKDGKAVIAGQDLFGNPDMSAKVVYTVDKSNKLITLKLAEGESTRLSEDSGNAESGEALQELLSSYIMTFNYNLEKQQLTLIEREYGSHLVFEKK